MNKKIHVDKKDILVAFKILETLRGDIDRIGSIGAHYGDEKMKEALNDYFTPQIYKKIVDGSAALGKYINEHTYIASMRNVKPYQFKGIL